MKTLALEQRRRLARRTVRGSSCCPACNAGMPKLKALCSKLQQQWRLRALLLPRASTGPDALDTDGSIVLAKVDGDGSTQVAIDPSKLPDHI